MLLFVNSKNSWIEYCQFWSYFFTLETSLTIQGCVLHPQNLFSWKSMAKSEVLLLIDAFFLRCYCLEFSLFRNFFSLCYIYTREKFESNPKVVLVKFIWFMLHFWRLYRRFERNDGSNARAWSIMHCLLKLPVPHENVLCDLNFSVLLIRLQFSGVGRLVDL